ncbi:solute carrier family 25 member 45 isoform X2 [Condylostylus longicornis]|uniref:solute carrier family 25 member 45 isoform X2 n=1 Tax=Condylostylus longicornis TaxID=2530218 RepID=UPI00244E3B31|nr:solute carrier family 25 member 45 isoform X2 [Condylostylus longicornis]
MLCPTYLNGIKGGMLFPLVTTGAVNSVLFGVYGNHLRQLQKTCHSDFQKEQLEYEHIFLAGSLAGFASCFVACPIELIKIRIQTQSYYSNNYLVGQRKTPFKLFMKILKSDGIPGLYRGLLPMMCRDVFPYGIYMLIYQKTTKFFEDTVFIKRKREANRIYKKYEIEHDDRTDFIVTTLAGAWAGILSWVCVIPFDVVKTLMQARDSTVYQGILDCIKTNVKTYGMRSLFRGSWILVVRAIPFNAATFLGYEKSFKYISGTEHQNMISINNKF